MNKKRYELLIADDDFLEQPDLDFLFKLRGFAVDIATTGIDAWNKIQNKQYSGIVLDNMLPGGGEEGTEWSIEKNGNSLHTGLKLLQLIDGIPIKPLVWILTALPDSDIESKEREYLFVVRYIKKEYSLKELADEIWSQLQKEEK